MDKRTGQIVDISQIVEEEKHNYIEIQRNLSAKEHMKAQIKLHAPCGCGSGKKFKFCFKPKQNN